MLAEQKLYPIVERWMKRQFLCFKTATNTGLKHSRIDVVGVRDVGGDLSGEVETISIEVKRGSEPFATACGQALGYRIYANRVYLADIREKSFSYDEISVASYLGVGLVQIQNKGTCKEILSSPSYVPMSSLNLRLLEKLRLGKCQFCGSFFETGDLDSGQPYSNLSRENLKRAIKGKKGLIFWNYEVADRKDRVGIRQTDKTFERRFICPDCVEVFISQLAE